MERERANSKYDEDPRVDWIPGNDPRARDHAEGGVFLCEIKPGVLPSMPPEPHSDFLWDFVIYSDEVVRVGSADGDSQRDMHAAFLVSAVGRQKALCGHGGYLTLDRMLQLLIGEPIS